MGLEILKTETNNFNKVIHLADTHIRLTKRHQEYREVFDKFFSLIKDYSKNETCIVFVGDLFHTKVEISPESLQLAKDFLKRCADMFPTVLISGNHDLLVNNKNRLDSLTPIVEAINHPDLYYLKKSGLYGLGNILFNNYSIFDSNDKYISGKDIPEIYKNKFEHLIALYHGIINNATTDLGYQISDKSKDVSMFDGHHIAMLGDIHLSQDLQKYDFNLNKPTIRFVGSFLQQNHGEFLKGHGFSLWDLKTKTYEHIEIPNDYGYFTVLINKGVLETDLKNIPKKAKLRIQCYESIATEVKLALSKIRLVSDVTEVSYIRVESDENKSFNSTVISNIELNDLSNSEYQSKLLMDHMKNKLNITDRLVTNKVIEINKTINSSIEKEEFAKNIRWKPIRFEFDNMFSYGEENIIDFTKLKNVVGLFSPNRSGKSNILSALSFCIFDKCDREFKASNVLNIQKMGFKCKFEFEINKIHYFIKREGKSDKNGNVKVNVEFWKIENDVRVDLNGEGRRDTNDIIRDYLGSYDDFVLTSLSVQNVKNAISFIDMGHTERKDLLAQFMGLTIYDKLYNKANDKLKELSLLFKKYKNDDFTKKLVDCSQSLTQYREFFNKENENLSTNSQKRDELQNNILDETKKIIKMDGNIPHLSISEEIKKSANSRTEIINKKIENQELTYNDIKLKLSSIDNEINAMEKIDIANTYKKYKYLSDEENKIQNKIKTKKIEVSHKIEKVEKSKNYDYDPACKFCVKNADSIIKESNNAMKELHEDKKEVESIMGEFNLIKNEKSKIEWVSTKYEIYTNLLEQRNKIKDGCEKESEKLNKLKLELKECENILQESENNIQLYIKHRESLDINHKIELNIQEFNKEIIKLNLNIKNINKKIMDFNGKISVLESQFKDIEEKIKTFKSIESEYIAYDYYIQCINRDGIPYEVISALVPEIEKQINNILGQIVEFTVHFEIDGKNVIPYIVYDNKKWIMTLSSGFERFILSLVIRAVLINISNLSRCGFIILDEGFGVLDSENMSMLNTLFSNFKQQFDFILIISHIDALKDMVESNIEITKDDQGFSKVNYI